MSTGRLLDGRLVVLTGAGMSTDSGIPDYRGPRPADTPPVPRPMTFQEFVADVRGQQRYWARAHVGWSRMGTAEPNAGHRLLAELDPHLVVTQNVDGLHEQARQRRLVALHGRISDVVCLDCGAVTRRTAVNTRMTRDNPGWLERHATSPVRPDGDVALEETGDFVVPTCEDCAGRLKPHVVFFGENVPRPRVQRCVDAVDEADALLVLGSSLTVMSGLRFVRQAAKRGIDVVIVNRGETRGDPLATRKLELGCTEFLEQLVQDRARTRMVGSRAASRATTSSGSAVSTSMTA